jgi:hypothetical protein
LQNIEILHGRAIAAPKPDGKGIFAGRLQHLAVGRRSIVEADPVRVPDPRRIINVNRREDLP